MFIDLCSDLLRACQPCSRGTTQCFSDDRWTHPSPPTSPPQSDTFKKNCTSLLKFFYPAVIVSSRWENLTIPAWTRSHWFDTGIMRSISAVAVHSVWPLNQWTLPTLQAAFLQQLHKHLFQSPIVSNILFELLHKFQFTLPWFKDIHLFLVQHWSAMNNLKPSFPNVICVFILNVLLPVTKMCGCTSLFFSPYCCIGIEHQTINTSSLVKFLNYLS